LGISSSSFSFVVSLILSFLFSSSLIGFSSGSFFSIKSFLIKLISSFGTFSSFTTSSFLFSSIGFSSSFLSFDIIFNVFVLLNNSFVF